MHQVHFRTFFNPEYEYRPFGAEYEYDLGSCLHQIKYPSLISVLVIVLVLVLVLGFIPMPVLVFVLDPLLYASSSFSNIF